MSIIILLMVLDSNERRISSKLMNSPENRIIKNQLLRSGTSAGANYEEARGAESRADFIHKLHITYKELRETNYWLRLLKSLNASKDEILLQHAIERSEMMIKILTKSIITAKSKTS